MIQYEIIKRPVVTEKTNIQKEVARAISEMVGMEPGQINVHIEDIDYDEEV